jgi:hypothetical protein
MIDGSLIGGIVFGPAARKLEEFLAQTAKSW